MGDTDGESIEERTERSSKKSGPIGTRAEKAVRDEEIVRDRLRRRSWTYIAEKHGIADRTCRDIWAKWVETAEPAYRGRDPLDIVNDMLAFYDAKVDELGEIVEGAENDSSRVAAVNAQMQAMGKMAELCQATGILPKNLGTLRLEMDVRVLAQKLIKVFNQHDASPELKEAVVAVLEPSTGE